MEFKEIKHLPPSINPNAVVEPKKNSPDYRGVYNLLFPFEEEEENTSISSEYTARDHQNPTFGSVSTLDWLKTWRSIEIN